MKISITYNLTIAYIITCQVDFSSEPIIMFKPFKCKIRRFFQPGIMFWFRQSFSEYQFLIKIHRVQVSKLLATLR